jgi:nitrate reductase delta subunit
MKTFRVLGLLLSYPQPEWLRRLEACRAVLQEERLLTGRSLAAVLSFVDTLESSDPYSLQEDYVATFDRGRAHSLHLFEHIHGESRDRGQAMVNLAATYAEKGLVIDRAELPDYLPLFLEFLSCCTPAEAVELLGEPVEVIAAIGQRLEEKRSPWAAVFGALVALSRTRPRQDWVDTLLASGPADDSLAALDREWEEAAAFAAPAGQQACQGCAAPRDGLHVKVTHQGD